MFQHFDILNRVYISILHIHLSIQYKTNYATNTIEETRKQTLRNNTPTTS